MRAAAHRQAVCEQEASEITARCLCAHPKLPLYLAGGDSVVQCWQFGQTIQGQGLNDHLRAQYKLSSGGKVAAGLAIHDVMRSLSSPVRTTCLGHCSSMAAHLVRCLRRAAVA